MMVGFVPTESCFPADSSVRERRSARTDESTRRTLTMTRPAGNQHCGNFGPPILTRRAMLRRAGMRLGTLALASLLLDDGLLSAAEPDAENGLLRPTGKARSVIFLFMGGGPSQVDTWDPKPELTRLHGQNVPESIARGVP